MNFLQTLHKVTLIFLLTIIFWGIKLTTLPVYGNEPGSPYIQVFFFKDYGLNSRSYSIAQDQFGVLYVGNFNGILEYNGAHWRQIKFPGRPGMTTTKDNKIYVGGLNQFGYLTKNNLNQTIFVSLLHALPAQLLPLGEVSSVKSIGNKVFFTTGKTLVCLVDGDVVLAETFTNDGFKIFVIDSLLFSFEPKKGISYYQNAKLVPYPAGEFFRDKTVEDILPFGKNFIVKTTDSPGFYIMGKASSYPFQSELHTLFERYGYRAGIRLNDGNYAFGTKRGGLLVMDSSGKLLNHVRRDHGLLEDIVSGLYVDHDDNLWVLHNNGLSRVEIPSPVSYFDRIYGIRGSVSSIIRHNGVMFFATSQGVFYLAKTEDSIFSKMIQVEGIQNSCYSFHAVGDLLFVSSEDGIFQIKNFIGKYKYRGELETAITSLEKPSRVFAGLKDGLAMIDYKAGIWSEPVKIPGITSRILSIAEEDDGIIWASTDFAGVYRITKKENFAESDVEHYQFSSGLPEKLTWITVINTSGGVVFSTSAGIYRFNSSKKEFYPDTLIGLDFSLGNLWLYPVVEDKTGNLWFNKYNSLNQANEAIVALYSKEKNNYRFKSLPLQRKKDFHIKTIYPDEEGAVWFGGFDGVLRLDTTVVIKKNKNFHALISKVTWNYDSVVYYGSNSESYRKEIRKFSFPINSIRFEFASTDYESEDKALFQYKLEGFENNWSTWSTVSFKDYTNLPARDYTFKLRVKNIHDEVSEVTTFSFRFIPPFYRTWWAYSFYLIIIGSFVNMLIRNRALRFARERHRLEQIINTRTEELLKQKEKSEALLANLLPKDTVDEIKSTGKASSQKYNLVTVLFSDIEGFTKIAEQMNPEILVDELDKFFLKFDSVVEKYNIEKIKTIGDAYMCAGGIPNKNRTNPVEVILAALEMILYMKQLRQDNQEVWDLRIGIHTGPVIAGVVGQKKLSYDIWGDTVNTASRMESSGEPGKINISGSTYELVHDFFACEYRGMMPVKYKGNIDMYFVKGIRPELSEDSKGLVPNELFFIKMQLFKLHDLEEFVFNRLENELSGNLYFHNFKHSMNVCATAELIGRAENLTEAEMLIVRTAAVFLNLGFLGDYRRNEDYRCEFAREILPRFKYSESIALKICHLLGISFDKMSPTGKLEKILFDSYYDFLGKVGLPEAARTLFREQKEYGLAENEKQWIETFISFVEKHEFYTLTATKMRDISKEEQIQTLRSYFASHIL